MGMSLIISFSTKFHKWLLRTKYVWHSCPQNWIGQKKKRLNCPQNQLHQKKKKKKNFIVIKSIHFVPCLTQLSAKSTWSQKPTWFQTIDSIVVNIDLICTTFHSIHLLLTGPFTINLLYLVRVNPTTTESFFFLIFDWVDFVDNQVYFGVAHQAFFWIDNFETNGLP